ncbi:hypothetical protein ACFQX6_00965 [Streptosporangium lutulentum]
MPAQEGVRGPRSEPPAAANGAGLNSGHYAVLGLVGSTGLTKPTDDILHGILDAIEYLRDKGGAGREIKGHRDGYATNCPGEPLYAWIKRGAPAPAPVPWDRPSRIPPSPAGPSPTRRSWAARTSTPGRRR